MKQDKECMRSRNQCCHGKSRSIIRSACVSVALAIQHAKRMRLIITSSWLLGFYNIFSILYRHDFRENVI